MVVLVEDVGVVDEVGLTEVALVPLCPLVGLTLVLLPVFEVGESVVGLSLVGLTPLVEPLPPLHPAINNAGINKNKNDFFILFKFKRTCIKFVIDTFFFNQ